MSSIDAFLRFMGLTPNTNAKGNKGRGAAQRRVKFLGLILVLLVSLLGVVHVLLPDSTLNSRVMRHAKQLRQRAGGSAAAAASSKSHHGSSGERTRRSHFNKHEIKEFILRGKLNLVELRTKHGELADAPEDSYDGVYGVFCRLNFAVHKEDPSSGMLLFEFVFVCYLCCVVLCVDLYGVSKMASRVFIEVFSFHFGTHFFVTPLFFFVSFLYFLY